MRLSIITLLGSLVIFVFATKLEDKANIKDLNSAFNLILDDKKFSEFGKVLSPNVTYDAGPGSVPAQGLPAAISILSKVIPNTTTSYSTVGTQLVKFLPPFDKENRSNLAEAVSYTTFVLFGSGNLTGEFFIIFAKYVDKEIVRTKEPGFGGWRFKNRKIVPVVSLPIPSTCATYRQPLPLPPFPPLPPLSPLPVAPRSRYSTVR